MPTSGSRRVRQGRLSRLDSVCLSNQHLPYDLHDEPPLSFMGEHAILLPHTRVHRSVASRGNEPSCRGGAPTQRRFHLGG